MVAKLRHILGGLQPYTSKTRQYLFRHQRHLNALAFQQTARAIRRRKDAERSSSDVIDTVLEIQPGWNPYKVLALQHRVELENFIEFVAAKNPQTILEIGLFQGGTLYVWTRAFNSTQQIVSVDQPFWNETILQRRRELYPSFSDDIQIDVIYGNSHAKSTYTEVGELLEGSVDFLFIDGDHTYDGVTQDFEMYRQLVDDDGIVAFHDIKRHAKDQMEKKTRLSQVDDLEEEYVSVGRPEWEVSRFWKEMKTDYEVHEFLTHPKQMGMGIGVVEL